MKLDEALDQLPVEKKARRLRVLWPLIEARLAEGVSHAAVLDFLNRNGFDLTEATYKNYLKRFRKAQRSQSSEPRQQPKPDPKPAPAVALSEQRTGRPATFDYDPRGIPDLLK